MLLQWRPTQPKTTLAQPALPGRSPKATRALSGPAHDVFTPQRQAVRFGSGPGGISDDDFQRWRDILTRKVREDLQNFRNPSQYQKTADGNSVMGTEDYIDLPRFMRGSNEGGTGQGQGDPGDQIGEVGPDGQPQGPGQPGQGQGPPQPGQGDGDGEGEGEGQGEQAGLGSGQLKKEDWTPKVSRYEIAQWIGDGLDLPNFQPRGKNNIQKIEEVWDTVSRQGTPGNVHRRRSFMEAMRREMAMKGADFTPSGIQWRKDDFRYFNTSEKPVPKENAVIIYVMDTSGSMSDKRKKMARDTNFYLSTYIQARYGEINAEYRGEQAGDDDFGNGVKEEFIVHDDEAQLLTSDQEGSAEHKFYTHSMSGGTRFSPAWKQVDELIQNKYPLDQWNVYVFHYTDGDPAGDDDEAVAIIQKLIDQGLNLFGYLQTEGSNSSRFYEKLGDTFGKSNPQTQFVRRVVLEDDTPEQCRKGVHAMLGTGEESSTSGQ